MLSLFAIAPLLQAPFALHSGDRVTFYGDSITEAGGYEVFIETYVRTRFPNLDVHFTNAGWGGDRVNGGGGGDAKTRIDLDFKPSHPTVVTCMLGMNDGGYVPWSEKTDSDFATGYANLIDLMKAAAPNARYTLIQTSPYDDWTRQKSDYNDVLLKMGKHVKELADKNNFAFVDFNTPVATAVQEEFKKNPEMAAQIIPDRVHPGQGGHLLMAFTLLKAWNAPSLVSEVELDGKTGDIKKAEGTKATKTGDLEWTQLDDCLPFPINGRDSIARTLADDFNVVEGLDDETLTVDNLESGQYSLSIDGHEMLKASADDLGKGLNLTRYLTPMLQQAFHVSELVAQRYSIAMFRWRQIERPMMGYADASEALRGLEKLDDEFVGKMPEAAKPVVHTFKLTKVPS